MKNFKDFNESLGIELDTPDDVHVDIHDVKVTLQVSKDGNNKDIIKLIPVNESHRHVVNTNPPILLDYWNRRGMKQIILALKKTNIPYKVDDATSKKTFNIWIEADLNLNLLAKLYLKDEFNI